jgi:nucleoid DNA-binding protein
MLDGSNTVSSIVEALAKKHHLSKREAELSVQQYFKELSRRNYIAFMADET